MSETNIDIPDLPIKIDHEYYGEEEEEEEEKEEEERVEEREVEEEAEEEAEEEIEEEPGVYNSDDFISEPFHSKASTFEADILEFDYSYGYDCKKYYNLVAADEDTIIYSTGNYIIFFDVPTRTPTFRRSAFGKGVGHITKNPNPEFPHIAVAENGKRPPIILYEWPSLDIVCLLKGGASKCFSHLNYSPDGLLLVSQGGEPDFLITIFNWRNSRILLRTKSNVHEVFRVMFSPEVPGQLTTCGLSHIKFWKMASTFTGLKLQGELGRFGKTEYSDILGIYPMSDEKVCSGSFWGNMLVWDEGLISLEVCQLLRKPLHNGPITQFYYDNGDLWSVGMDGYVRVWFYDSIDQADPPDYDRTVEVEPLHTFHVPDCILMSIQKVNDKWRDFQFYAQDGNGGIWLIDVNTFVEPNPPVQLYKCHAGQIMDMAACPWGPYLVSLGIDGRMQLYNYHEQKLLFRRQFPAKGVTITWLSTELQSSGDELILGFDDGLVRVIILTIDEPKKAFTVQIIQRIKPHNKPIVKSAVNEKDLLMVTASEDLTIFIFQLKREHWYIFLQPIGFIRLPGLVTCLTWHSEVRATVLAGCIRGHFLQVKVPIKPQNYTKVTYILKETATVKLFLTYKSQILRDIKLAKIEAAKEAKLKRKLEELLQLKSEDPDMEFDDEEFLADSEEDEPLEPLFIPEIPNKVLWMQVTPENTIWLSMDGYDAGYIYEYSMNKTTDIPDNFTLICDGDEYPMINYVYSSDKKYLILAMNDGSLRVVKVNEENWRDLSDYWQVTMHDNFNGFIPKMCFSYDEKYFFSCGYDGNLFSYRFLPEDPPPAPSITPRTKLSRPNIEIEDIDGYTIFTLDEALIRAEEDRINKIANENKEIYMEKIKVLKDRFQEMITRNSKLLPTQVIPRSMLELDPRISEDLEKRLETNLMLVKKRLEYSVGKSKVAMQKLRRHFVDPVDVFPIVVNGVEKDVSVAVIRQRKLSSKFHHMLGIIEHKIRESEKKMKPPERPVTEKQAIKLVERKKRPLEYFLMGLSPSVIEQGIEPRLARCLNRYRERKQKLELRREEWLVFNSMKPEKGINNPEDEIELTDTIANIGDFKLKTALDYKVPPQLRESTVKKYKQLLFARMRQYTINHDFSMLVLKLRNDKSKMHDYVSNLTSRLEQIHEELDPSLRKEAPPIPIINEEDFVEKHLNVKVDLRISNEQEALIPVVEPSRGNLLEKEVLLTVKPLAPLIPPPPPIKGMPVKVVLVLNDLEVEALCEDVDTPWEAEMRSYRLSRNLFEQDLIIQKIVTAIKEFDEKVIKLCEKKITVRRDADLLNLYILTLNQELNILKKFEIVEDALQNIVNTRFAETLDMEDRLTKLGNSVETHKTEVERLQEEEKSIWQVFSIMVVDNKFYDFLRRIFKKKYRPPKVHNPDESSSSSESSESSESEQDAASVDSRDFAIIKLDENVCPKGCDPVIYEKTFELRNQRHGIEVAIRDEKATIEFLLKEIEVSKRKLKGMESLLQESQKELESYQREKQTMLNLVECVVILKLNQMQHLISENQSSKIGDVLVFSKHALSKLYKRVAQLHNETIEVKSRHKGNVEHMTRMGTDCKYMKKRIGQIRLEIKELMHTKFRQEIDLEEIEELAIKKLVFGNAINLDDMEEWSMRKMVFEFRVHEENIESLYSDEIRTWITKFDEKQGELTEMLKLNTAKLDLVALLNKEKTELANILHTELMIQEHKHDGPDKFIEAFQNDIEKLSKVLRKQRREILSLELEIKRLKTKGLIIEPKKLRPPEKESKVLHVDSFEYDYTVPKRKPFRLNLELPDVELPEKFTIPMSVKNIVMSIIIEMIDSVKIASLSKFIKEELIEQLIYDIMQRPSVEQISDNLQALLPDEPNDEQLGIIDAAAEQIFALQQSGTSHEIVTSNILLNTVIDNNIEYGGSISQVMTNIISELVSRLPINFLLNDSSVHTIIGKVNSQMRLEKFSKEQLISSILTIRSSRTAEMQMLVDKILETVYATGMDYLYFIEQ